MLEERLLEQFAAQLMEEVSDRIVDVESDEGLVLAAALTEAMLGYLEEAGVVSGHDLCPHQDARGIRRPCRVTGYALAEDSSRLELFTAPDQIEGATLPVQEISRLAGWAARFFEYAVKGDHGRFQNSPATLEAAARIQQYAGSIDEVRVHVLTNLRVRDRSVDSIDVQNRIVSTEVWDIERLYRARGDEVTREHIEIDFTQLLGRPLSCLEMKPRPKEYETFLVILPGELLFKLFDEYGPRLFEFNVRSFLQAKGAVNRGIQKTIREQPGRFLAYNNGLTATADEIEVATSNSETVIKRIRGLQIVNGAQTTASIHRAHKIEKLSLQEVAVSMKLTMVPPTSLSEFVPLIARYANTQNPIQIADLSASDAFHQKFESLSESIWAPGEESRWFYERARGAYQMRRSLQGTTPARRREFDRTHPRDQHFGKTDLAKYLMTWWGLPHVVSRGAQKNYAAFMFGLRERMGEDWVPDGDFYRSTIARAIIFKAAQSVVRKAKLQSYAANVVAYMVALVATKFGVELDLNEVWEAQRATDELHELFATWAPQVHAAIVSSAGNRNVTEWCKKEDCWEEIKTLELVMSVVPPEMGGTRDSDAEAEDDADQACSAIDLCLSFNGAEWAKIVAWAASSGQVDEYDRRVAHTLSGYAMDGWSHHPSIKQAVRGQRVIAAARVAGVI